MDHYRTASSEIGRWTDAPARVDDQGELVRPSAMAAAPSAVETGTIQTGTIPWTDAEYRYQGTYTGGLKDGKPHGKGDFAQEGGRKHLIGDSLQRRTRTSTGTQRWKRSGCSAVRFADSGDK